MATETLYCSPQDVSRVLANGTVFDDNTTPTSEDVREMIRESMDRIDSDTGRAFRTRYSGTATGRDTTAKYEYFNIPDVRRYRWSTGIPIKLPHPDLVTLSSGSGDAFEVWNGSSYDDWLSTKTEGRASDYWLDYTIGKLYLLSPFNFFLEKALRLKYRYGATTVPYDIRKACAILVAINIIRSDDRSAVLAETGDPTRMTHDLRISNWMGEYNRTIRRYASITVLHPLPK